MVETVLSRALKKYAVNPASEEYSRVIREFFWCVVNYNKLYFVEDKENADNENGEEKKPLLPTSILDGDGKRYVVLFSRQPDGDEAKEFTSSDADSLARNIVLEEAVQGIILDMDIGASLIIPSESLLTIIRSADDYRASL